MVTKNKYKTFIIHHNQYINVECQPTNKWNREKYVNIHVLLHYHAVACNNVLSSLNKSLQKVTRQPLVKWIAWSPRHFKFTGAN